jgi:hypothetical protein
MGIKTLTGHLTARERQIVAWMIEHGKDAAGTGAHHGAPHP